MSTPEQPLLPFAPLSVGLYAEAAASVRLDGETHVVGGAYTATEPRADESETAPPASAEQPVELTSTGIAYAAELDDLEAQRQLLDDRIADAKAAIQAEMGDAETATISGRPVFTWKRHTRRSFDQTLAKKLLGAAGAAACQKVTEVRSFRRASE